MPPYIIAWDLGTGGNKASLYDISGECLSACFVPYNTMYPSPGLHEQRPVDWWRAVVESTQKLLSIAEVNTGQISCCGISGHSLGVVPLDKTGELLRNATPIWSDTRAEKQACQFFERVDENEWYLRTGSGFPAALYSVFKIMWYRDNDPDMFRKIDMIVGTKDYINYRLTGRMVTDPSYASGSGVFDLSKMDYSNDLIEVAKLHRNLLPEIIPSTASVGKISPEAAKQLGLPETIFVSCGGVDNSCMALGARNTVDGRIYNSLGSSSWIAISSKKPLLDEVYRPYVFAHVVPDLYTSALAIFSAGTTLRWVRDTLCANLAERADRKNLDVYDVMTALASRSKPGANGLIFNPSLAGGTILDGNSEIRGALLGLDLSHTQGDIIRAAMEGIALGLRSALDKLRDLTPISDEMLMVGGGSRSALWRQICADALHINVVKSTIDEQAAALGAAAIAAVGSGIWENFDVVEQIHTIEHTSTPSSEQKMFYDELFAIFKKATSHQADLAPQLQHLRNG